MYDKITPNIQDLNNDTPKHKTHSKFQTNTTNQGQDIARSKINRTE